MIVWTGMQLILDRRKGLLGRPTSAYLSRWEHWASYSLGLGLPLDPYRSEKPSREPRVLGNSNVNLPKTGSSPDWYGTGSSNTSSALFRIVSRFSLYVYTRTTGAVNHSLVTDSQSCAGDLSWSTNLPMPNFFAPTAQYKFQPSQELAPSDPFSYAYPHTEHFCASAVFHSYFLVFL